MVRMLMIIVPLVLLVIIFLTKLSSPITFVLHHVSAAAGVLVVAIPFVLLAIFVFIERCSPVIVKELCDGDFIIIMFQEFDHESVIILVNGEVSSLTIVLLKELGHRNIILVNELIYGFVVE